MVKIRLQRHGRKKRPYYHIVAADSRSPRDGRIIEDLGRFNPSTEPQVTKLDVDRVIHWINNGARPSDTVKSLLKKEGIFYRLHLLRWGKSEEEISETLAAWHEEKGDTGHLSRAESLKAQIKAEEEAVKKQEAEEAKAKAEAEAKAKEEAEKAAAAEAEAAKKAEAEAAAAEEEKKEEAAAADDSTDEEAKATEADSDAKDAKAEEAEEAEEEEKKKED